MRSSRTITLFSERPELSQRPSSFVVSVLVHGAALGLLSLGIIYTPEVNDRLLTERYTLRRLDLHAPKPEMRRTAGSGIAYPGPHAEGPKSSQPRPKAGRKSAAQEAALRLPVQAPPGPQTLVQPDIRTDVKLTEEVPVPTVVIWSPKKAATKTIVAPLPEKATASDVEPSVHAPNEEINLGDLGISATNTPTKNPAIPPSTTSPLVVHGPDMVQLAPVTTSESTAQPTPTAVMSLSDLRMPDGTVTLPPVSETSRQNSAGALTQGQAGIGNRARRTGAAGTEQGEGDSGDPAGVAGDRSGLKVGSGAGFGSGDEDGTEQFTLPKNGQFGAVVVGASLKEEFPETAGVWSDRLAYTVYLHVGLAKSWILQYSLPRSAEAASAGDIARLEAPWPYSVVRPNIAAGAINADALLVHGYVNQAGRFEELAIAFPPEFPQAQFVLNSLDQWQFRPAAQNGQTQRVEVLLIIPEEPE